MPEPTDSLGVIRYLGPDVSSDLKIGMKVFYGTTRKQIRMGDADIQVMEEDNVYAIAEEEKVQQEEASV